MRYKEALRQLVPEYETNAGHGHVWKRPDGLRARCGGPAICSHCKIDAQKLIRADDHISCTVIA